MRKLKVWVGAALMLMLTLTVGGAWAYDPPRIIGELRGAAPDSQEFGNQFCWVGDQNGDGYDDLLVIHDPYGTVRKAKLYFGGQQMDNIPDLIFGDSRIIDGIGYLGRINSENDHWFVISSYARNSSTHQLTFYKGGEQLDTIPDIIWSQPVDSCYGLGAAERMYPVDFNNDGFNDLAVALMDLTHDVQAPSARMIFFGGNEFDSTADWIDWFALPRLYNAANGFNTGGDINDDGYDDLFDWHALFLGGASMDTAALWTYQNVEGDTAEGDTTNRTLYQFTILPDVDGDGYDDWGCYWTELGERQDQDGYYLFYGSAHPDLQPDIDLEGNRNIWDTYGRIAGGDFNGDGLGDIVTSSPGGFSTDGEVNLYFGSRWIDREADVKINAAETYGEQYRLLGFLLGAIGDYNGDHIQDFTTCIRPGNLMVRLLALSGSHDWRVSVPQGPLTPNPTSPQWQMTASPNPFNSSTTLSYSVPRRASIHLGIYDLSGRLISTLVQGIAEAGKHSVVWPSPGSGVYFAVLSVEGEGKAVKKVVCVR